MVVFEADLKIKTWESELAVNSLQLEHHIFLCVPDLVCTEQEQPPWCSLKERIFIAVNVMLQLFVSKKWIVSVQHSVTNRTVHVCANTIQGILTLYGLSVCKLLKTSHFKMSTWPFKNKQNPKSSTHRVFWCSFGAKVVCAIPVSQ